MRDMKSKDEIQERITEMLTDTELVKKLHDIDNRVCAYVMDVGFEPERHNRYEMLGVLKFLRYMETYYFDYDTVHLIYRALEGIWEDGKHLGGGFKISGNRGEMVYQLLPLQCFTYAAIHGFCYYVDLGAWDGRTQLLPTECLHPETGHVLDLRRVVSDMVCFWPRKTDKTGIAANECILDFMFGENESSALLASNTSQQAQICFKKIRDRLVQLDPKHKKFRFTVDEINWKEAQAKKGNILALTAGAKTKDGLFGSVCVADEYGSAVWVKNRSDMADLLQVCQSSMGPRRNPLTVITTTAGNTIGGPFEIYLRGVKGYLEDEVA